MKKIVFAFCIFLLAACSKESSETKYRIVYKSKPEITVFPFAENIDSLRIKGYSKSVSIEDFKGTLPDLVATEFDLKDTYVYSTYNTIVDLPDESIALPKYALVRNSIGYNEAFEFRAVYSAPQMIGTYLIYIKRDTHGKNIDRWLPIAPEDLECYVLLLHRDAFDK